MDNHKEAIARAKATESERLRKLEEDFKNAVDDRLTRRLAERYAERYGTNGSDNEHPEIDVSEIKGVVGRSGIHGLPGGGFASVTYTGGAI